MLSLTSAPMPGSVDDPQVVVRGFLLVVVILQATVSRRFGKAT